MTSRLILISVAAALAAVVPHHRALAHGGGLDAEGCHNDRKRGGYHCHRAPSRPSSDEDYSGNDPSGPFRNCAEARAAGAAPVRIGDPGYAPHLDRDRDGIGCE